MMAKSGFLKHLIEKSKTKKLPGFRSISLYDTVVRIKREVIWDDMIERASAISFNTAMALPPMILFLCTLIPIIAKFNFIIELDLVGQLNEFVKTVIPAQNNYQPILDFINSTIERPRNTLLIFSIMLSIFFSSNAIMGIMRSFDKNYPGFVKRKGIKKRLNAIRITLTLVFLFILCLALLIAQKSVLSWLGIDNVIVTSVWLKLRWILIVLLVFAIISYIYRHAPSVDKKWKLITPGSVLATALVIISTLAFSWWVSFFGTYNKLYGSIGTIIFVMVLIFFNALILLMGFELNANIYALSKTKNEKNKHQIPNTSKLK
ncbi:MAG: YihY/virulence factor BrkB family protein [Niabella sp.]|nr:MAG: YihY/virulence factor BrkB family protein [Niabella sp.]